jgi:BMFP domain-containing protein YqiC
MKSKLGWLVNQSKLNFKLQGYRDALTMETLGRKVVRTTFYFTLILTFVFAPLPGYYAQAQVQAPARNELASLNEPAQPLPARATDATTNTAATAGTTTTAATTATTAASPATANGASPDKPASTSESEATIAIMKELEDMEKRIEELEAALKARDAAAQPTAGAANPTDPAKVVQPAPVDSGLASSSAAKPQDKKPAPTDPFSVDDWTWLNGTSRNHDTPLAMKYFTPEIRFDANYIEDYNQPKDHTMGGATESFRNGEFQLEQASVGGDLRVGNVRARILTMDGLFSTTTPRNDGSYGVGQWDLRGAYKYVSEAWGGYHFNVNHGLNIDAGIFVSYIGLFSYYNFDNWAYQPSFVSSNTPWFFNGLRIQWFPTEKLKIEPWIINGWQSYAKFNGHLGLGGQILWRPHPWISLVFNNYGMGTDTLGVPGRSRIHTDDSIQIRYYHRPDNFLDSMAFSATGDLGCEYGGSAPGTIVSCHNNSNGHPKQMFAGWMLYDRMQFKKDLFGVTLGGGVMDNPGRYLTLLPPINGADAVSGSPYFQGYPGSVFKGWDSTATFDWMPSQFATFRFETGYRYANVPYWTGRQGITPPGANYSLPTTNPSHFICSNGADSGVGAGGISDNSGNYLLDANLGSAETACFNLEGGSGGPSLANIWQPDMRKSQWENTISIMVKF